jgi:3-oxoadipate enol-lactonase
MQSLRSGDAEIVYDVVGTGPPVVLLHPFPAHHGFWKSVAQGLSSRYRLLLPDLRAHGDSGAGQGPATMEKHAGDLLRVMDDAMVGRAVCVGVSIGGYVLWEFWRRERTRVRALVVCNTKAQPDNTEARANRLKAAEDVLKRGTEPFIESLLPRLMGSTTVESRPDLVDGARRMMQKMSPDDIAQVQRGMAERPDSVATLKTINVPTLVITGEEDVLTPVADADLIHRNIPRSQLQVISKAGHFSPYEQPEAALHLLRRFLDALPPA